ncbi:MAG: T9SS type A sorting domain-containing protein [Flavobacteriales bacterium]|nr:T9SS type A sorting domain-containing protein [Flavobacteriales bacterium]
MRTLSTLTAMTTAGLLAAQCVFTPTISPLSPILCPGEVVELSTQSYDAYQWYRDGQPLPGATQQTLQVDYFNYAGSSVSVEATLDGCTEMSASNLVDGWVFLPPFVMHGGDEPIFFGPSGESTYCWGADVQLTLGMPYTANIQWYMDGVSIDGANSPTLVVTVPGSYTVTAAPGICPNSITNLGVSIDIDFIPPTQPVIVADDELLCAMPPGQFHQWYHNGSPVISDGLACINADVPGMWTVYVDYGFGCQVMSEPYLSVGYGSIGAMRPWNLYPNPSNGIVTVAWNGAVVPGTYWSVTDLSGREVRSGFMPMNSMLQLELGDLAHGTYLFQAAHHHKALGHASRFTIMH